MENKSLRILGREEQNKVKGRASLLAAGLAVLYVLAAGTLIVLAYGSEVLGSPGYIIGVLLAGSALLLFLVASGKVLAAQGCAEVLIMAEPGEPGEQGLPAEIEERFRPGSLLWRALRRH